MGSARFLAAVTALLFVLPSAPVAAQNVADFPSSSDDRAGGEAAIVLVANARESAELRAVLAELLERQGVTCSFSEAGRFEPEAFLGEPAERQLLVFVVIEPGRAGLYFRSPHGDRFLLRKLALQHGLDELGKELVAQVVESSTLALLRSSVGISRAEARAELEQETVREERAPPPLPAPAVSRRPQRDSPSRFELGVGARYGVLWSGPDLGVSHGPAAELGVAYRTRVRLRLRASAEYWFPSSLSSSLMEADIGATALRGVFDAGLPLGANRTLYAGIGAGTDLVRVEPVEPAGSEAVPAPAKTHTVPVVRLELGYEIRWAPIELGFAAFVDMSLVDTHYDVAGASGETEPVGAPWPVRPGTALTVRLVF